ncbi:hypothetical protein [Amycolatopsis sp. La24]|uniref:hypothetical protein n=1 Tax=Amycolatopsis sp. La24 TaxID=3028304 RepID=UPI0023B0026B|nr:hypothetical protein [Amycolatopsis sp. La24]
MSTFAQPRVSPDWLSPSTPRWQHGSVFSTSRGVGAGKAGRCPGLRSGFWSPYAVCAVVKRCAFETG